ncbi:MAG: prepilin-type N-terminal cleavage/methylation domain-containing protein [Desulfobacterales bacterium]|nr:prepilin-type N-terminal cleavage/methylation domain-containing protein [Desulfobacterales bacterium]
MNTEKAYISYTETQTDKLKKEDGFTLIEVLIAITIFAVGLLAVAVLQTSAIKMNSTAGKLTNLSTLGMDQIEKLSSLPYTDPALNAGTYQPPSPSANYSISYTVVNNPPPVSNTKNITVTVSGRGKTAVISFFKPNVGT